AFPEGDRNDPRRVPDDVRHVLNGTLVVRIQALPGRPDQPGSTIMTSENTIRPFRIEIGQEALDDLHDRLRRTRYTPDAPAAYGVPLSEVRRLAEYWRDGYDWRAHETRLNEHPQFVTEIDGQRIHFLHVRSAEPDALPLICTHGWPMSVFEYLDLIGPLTDPRAHGRDAADAFDLVIPSIPGVAFSGPTSVRG